MPALNPSHRTEALHTVEPLHHPRGVRLQERLSFAADQADLVRIIKRKLKKIQYRPQLINGCLAATGLKIDL